MLTRKTYLTIIGIAAALRLIGLWSAPLWYDENFTLLLARMPFERMIAATAGDVHPPLWYLIEWTMFHALPSLPAWAIRIPAFLFSLLSLNVFVLLCEDLRLPDRVRVAALILMALMPMQIWYAQEGRMYAMLEFLVLTALHFGLRRNWLIFTLTAIALMYTQNYGMFYLATIGVILIIMDRGSLKPLAAAAVVTAVSYAPWAFVVAAQMHDIEGRYWIMDSSAGAALGAVYKQFWASSMMSEGVISAYVVTFGFLLIGLYTLISRRDTSWWIVLTMALVPLSLALIVSWIWQPLLLFRPLIGISPFLYIIVCAPLAMEIDRPAQLYAAIFAMPVLMFGLGGYYLNIGAMKSDGATAPLTRAYEYVRANWEEGDIIYYADDGPMINLMPYTETYMPQFKMPECDTITGYAPVLGSLSVATREALGARVEYLHELDYRRAWVFAPRSPLHPQCYEEQIKDIAPEGTQLITVDDNKFISSGVWLVEQ